MYANQHAHMGNRTSGRAESFHSGLKKALGNQSASRLPLTVKRMHAYYEQKVNWHHKGTVLNDICLFLYKTEIG